MVISESMDESYCTRVLSGNTVIFSDTTDEKGGKGRCMRPHDLLCAGFASCLNITTRMVLERKNIPYDKVTVKVELDRNDEKITKFLYDIDIVGDISENTKHQIRKIVGNCPVRKTLAKDIIFVSKN